MSDLETIETLLSRQRAFFHICKKQIFLLCGFYKNIQKTMEWRYTYFFCHKKVGKTLLFL